MWSVNLRELILVLVNIFCKSLYTLLYIYGRHYENLMRLIACPKMF